MIDHGHEAGALFSEAVKLQLANQLSAAELLYRELLRIEPRHHHALNNLGLTVFEQGRVDEAVVLIEDALRLRPDFPEAKFNLGKIQIERGEYDLAIACMDAVLALKPDDANAYLALAYALELRGSFEDAEAYYYDVAQFFPALKLTSQIAFGRETYDAIHHAHESTPSPLILTHRQQQSPDYVVVVSCDTRYVLKYCDTLFASMHKVSGDFLLHLHVIGPDQAFLDRLPDRIARSAVKNFAISYEENPKQLLEGKERNTYFACARFLHLSNWLEQYNLPLLVIDADAVVEGQLQDIVNVAASVDVGLYFRSPHRAPWLDIIANAVVANPSANAIRYFREVASYIRRYLKPGKAHWHLDQIALYCTLKMSERFGGVLAVQAINSAADRVLWQIGQSYDHKMLEERYTRHLMPLPKG